MFETFVGAVIEWLQTTALLGLMCLTVGRCQDIDAKEKKRRVGSLRNERMRVFQIKTLVGVFEMKAPLTRPPLIFDDSRSFMICA